MKKYLYLELLTPCYGIPDEPGTALPGVHADRENLDPTKEFTYTFMRQLFTEIVQNVSKDSFIHLGMDEVRFYFVFVNGFRTQMNFF